VKAQSKDLCEKLEIIFKTLHASMVGLWDDPENGEEVWAACAQPCSS